MRVHDSPSRLAAAQRTPSFCFSSTNALTRALFPEPWGPCSVTMPEVKYGARRRALAAICSAAVLIVPSCGLGEWATESGGRHDELVWRLLMEVEAETRRAWENSRGMTVAAPDCGSRD